MIQLKIYSILILGFILISDLMAEESSNTLPSIIVEDKLTPTSLTTPTIDTAKEALQNIPGATSIISAEDIRSVNSSNLEEVLNNTPGIYSRSRFGSDEIRLSIRGSGISQTFNTRGVRILRDGLPISEADGNVRTQLIDTLNAQYIEIFRGANALEYGAALLGGAINLVSPNSLTIENYPLRFETGSNNYLRGQVAYGWVSENGIDSYHSITGIEQDGFRDNSQQETLRYYGNIGKQWNSQQETRVHVDFQDSNLELPGSLTKQQLEQDPSQANSSSQIRNSQRDINLFRISAQHNVLLGADTKASFGISYQHLDTRIPLGFAFLEADQNDASVSTRVEKNIKVNNRDHNITFGGLALWGDNEGERFEYEVNDIRGRQIRDDDDRAWGLEAYLQDRIQINSNTDLVIGSQLIHATRKTSETPINPNGTMLDSVNRSENYTGLNPRIGYIKYFQNNLSLFGNISRSYEPPTVTEFSSLLDDGSFEILDAQKATTIELGIRQTENKKINFEIAAYYSKVEDEILIQQDPSLPSGSGETVVSNANKTNHSGIEFGLDGSATNKINFKMSYTYNDFEFNNDDTYGNNRIPGIPKHLFNAELMYRTTAGLSFGPTLNYTSSWYVDFENTVKSDSYTLLGAKLNYEFNNGTRFFLQGINLTDEVYASNTAITDRADANSALFNPGQDRSIYIGLEIKI